MSWRSLFGDYCYRHIDKHLAMEKDFHTQKPILKKQKSLPYRSGQKNVHFADCHGLSLVSVHKISMDDLTLPTKEVNQVTKDLKLTFPQPIASNNYTERLNNLSVSLENVLASNFTIMGTIKVKNIAYHKSVLIRYTLNSWKTYEDTLASYVQNSCDGSFDRFSFGITVPGSFKPNDKIEFAVCYRTASPDHEFWDNNDGKNYVILCEEKSVPRNHSYGLLWSRVIPNFKRLNLQNNSKSK